jgi:hypothetical protein
MIPKALVQRHCITVAQLKEWLENVPDKHDNGEDAEVWIDMGDGTSYECVAIWPLNVYKNEDGSESCDVLLAEGERLWKS